MSDGTQQSAQLFGGHRIPKGVSGNPGGRYATRLNRRFAELYETILADLGGADALSAMDQTLLGQACRLLARAEGRLKDPADAVSLSNAAVRMLGSLRDKRRSKDTAPTFDQYLARGADASGATSDSPKPVGSFNGDPGCNAPAKTETRTSGRRRVSKRHRGGGHGGDGE